MIENYIIPEKSVHDEDLAVDDSDVTNMSNRGELSEYEPTVEVQLNGGEPRGEEQTAEGPDEEPSGETTYEGGLDRNVLASVDGEGSGGPDKDIKGSKHKLIHFHYMGNWVCTVISCG